MIEAAMIWNEPNNKSHWDLEADPDWRIFARMARLAGQAIAAEAPTLPFGAEEVQEWGLRRSYELLSGRAPRIQWHSLFDLPAAWPATTRHREAEGSSYYRHFHMGLLDACARGRSIPSSSGCSLHRTRSMRWTLLRCMDFLWTGIIGRSMSGPRN